MGWAIELHPFGALMNFKMNFVMKSSIFLSTILFVFCYSIAGLAQDKEKDCDFSGYKAIRIQYDGWLVKKKVAPEYPRFAKDAKIQGTVVVKVLVNQQGDVIKACGLTGHPLLWDAAQKAALAYKFNAFQGSSVNKKTTPVYRGTVIVFNFKL